MRDEEQAIYDALSAALLSGRLAPGTPLRETAIIKGDGAGASKAMRAHLSLIETRLRPGTSAASRDAVQTLRALWAACNSEAKSA